MLFLASLLCFVHAHKTSTHLGVRGGRRVVGTGAAVPAEHDPAAGDGDRGLRVLACRARAPRGCMQCAVFMLAMIAMLMPWIIRNYRYTGTIQPTSTHGGIQLWYGTLQVGPYLESRAHNPRSIFASAAFDYTSLERPIVISAKHHCSVRATSPRLVYRTDRDPALKWLDGQRDRRQPPGVRDPGAVGARPRSITSSSPAASTFPERRRSRAVDLFRVDRSSGRSRSAPRVARSSSTSAG